MTPILAVAMRAGAVQGSLFAPQVERFALPGTIWELLGTLPYYTSVEFDEHILDMARNTDCGAACERILRMGSDMMEACADVRNEIHDCVVRQVEIFYFG